MHVPCIKLAGFEVDFFVQLISTTLDSKVSCDDDEKYAEEIHRTVAERTSSTACYKRVVERRASGPSTAFLYLFRVPRSSSQSESRMKPWLAS